MSLFYSSLTREKHLKKRKMDEPSEKDLVIMAVIEKKRREWLQEEKSDANNI